MLVATLHNACNISVVGCNVLLELGFCCDCMNQATKGTLRSDHKNTFLSLLSLKQQGSNNCFSAVCRLNKNISFTLHVSVATWCYFLFSVLFYFLDPNLGSPGDTGTRKDLTWCFTNLSQIPSVRHSLCSVTAGSESRQAEWSATGLGACRILGRHAWYLKGFSFEVQQFSSLFQASFYYANVVIMACFIHLQHSQAFLHLSRKSQMRLGGAIWSPHYFLSAHKSPSSFTLTLAWPCANPVCFFSSLSVFFIYFILEREWECVHKQGRGSEKKRERGS